MEVQARRRVASLDGLRGVAALVVVLSHIVEAGSPALANGLLDGTPPRGVAGLFVSTPLTVVWAGPEFVIVFFVLSGYVLTAGLRGRMKAGRYYPARLVRLYLPVWASVGCALALAALVTPQFLPGATDWLNGFAPPITFGSVWHALVLIGPVPGATVNGVLWSMHWEVLFSLLLPVVLLVLRARVHLWPLLVGLALGLILISPPEGAGHYLPPFILGAVLATAPTLIARLKVALTARTWGPALMIVLAATCLTADRWATGVSPAVARTTVACGAVLVVLVPLTIATAAAALCRPTMQWLGRRSFSLYLTHEPVVVALAVGLHLPSIWVLAALALPLSALVAELFYRVVERPAHRVAQRLGRRPAEPTSTRESRFRGGAGVGLSRGPDQPIVAAPRVS
jgi:peptidoglycan/LPS O-acetylase OafA/YrhL